MVSSLHSLSFLFFFIFFFFSIFFFVFYFFIIIFYFIIILLLLLLLTRDTTRRLCNFFVYSLFFTSDPSPIPVPLLPSVPHYPPISYFHRVRPHLGTSVQPTESPIVTSISHALTNKDGLAYRYFKLQCLTSRHIS